MTALWTSLLPLGEQGDDSRCAVSADGVRVLFADGVERLCATSGLWNVPLGYGNEHIAEAIAEAAHRLSYGGVFRYENTDARRAADALVQVAGPHRYSRVLFSTGGGAANDLAMKLARQYQLLRGHERRRIVVGLQGSFHGMTFGAFSLTGEDLGQETYGVDRRLVRHLPANDVGSLETLFARMGAQVAAVVVEPVAGSGTRPLTAEFLDALARSRDEHGFLLVADEVATGFARTGPIFASDDWDAAPDMMIVSKALTNGTCATAAVLAAPHVEDLFRRKGATLFHAETAAGSAISCAAILATLEEMERLDVTALAARVSGRLDAGLADLVASAPEIDGHHGVGAFRTVRILGRDGAPVGGADVTRIVDAVRHEGVIVHPGVGGVQLVPSLVYTADDVTEALAAVSRGVRAWRHREREVA